MKKTTVMFSVLSCLVSGVAFASTVTTVEDNRVTVENDNTSQATTVVQPVVPAVPVVPVETVTYVSPRDPRELEGEIIRVDYPRNEIVVRDIDNRERKVTMKQGMINTYKVDDYVKIYLMADMREAKTVETRHTADIDGQVISVDNVTNRVVVRQNGVDSVVIFQPGIVHNYRAGDHVKLYVVTDYNDLREAKMIRVR